MENMRFILIIAIGFVVMMLMQKWQEDYGVQETVTNQETITTSTVDTEEIPETPVFKELQPIQVPIKPSSPGTISVIISFIMFGIILYSIRMSFLFVIQARKRE